jgi:hypothetical protein
LAGASNERGATHAHGEPYPDADGRADCHANADGLTDHHEDADGNCHANHHARADENADRLHDSAADRACTVADAYSDHRSSSHLFRDAD